MTMERRQEKRCKPNSPEQIPYLLPEIITEILSRLPVKSLLQFRSVSKSWRSIISDPKFIKTHLTICSNNQESAHHRLIFSSNRPLGQITLEKCHLSHVMNGVTINPTELDYPMKHPGRYVWIVGSINGLICIAIDEHDTFLWNPSTRISKKLPRSGVRLHSGYLIVYGFGYVESVVDDYRFVGIYCKMGSGYVCETEVMVYSLRTDCWRRIDDFPSATPLDESGTFINGAIHWAASRKTSLGFSWLIVSLDLANETYSEVAQPSYGEGEFELNLGVLGECLCVMSVYGCHTDVWMMKEYGVKDSWTKLASIPFLTDPRKYEYPVLLYMSKNDEILLDFGSRIVLYDPRSKSFRNPVIPNFDVCLEANTYIESLVSPLIHEGPERQQ